MGCYRFGEDCGERGWTQDQSERSSAVSIRQNPRQAICADTCRGVIDTPLAGGESAGRDAFLQTTAMKRIGQPEEVARAILFLLSESASFVTASVCMTVHSMLHTANAICRFLTSMGAISESIA